MRPSHLVSVLVFIAAILSLGSTEEKVIPVLDVENAAQLVRILLRHAESIGNRTEGSRALCSGLDAIRNSSRIKQEQIDKLRNELGCEVLLSESPSNTSGTPNVEVLPYIVNDRVHRAPLPLHVVVQFPNLFNLKSKTFKMCDWTNSELYSLRTLHVLVDPKVSFNEEEIPKSIRLCFNKIVPVPTIKLAKHVDHHFQSIVQIKEDVLNERWRKHLGNIDLQSPFFRWYLYASEMKTVVDGMALWLGGSAFKESSLVEPLKQRWLDKIHSDLIERSHRTQGQLWVAGSTWLVDTAFDPLPTAQLPYHDTSVAIASPLAIRLGDSVLTEWVRRAREIFPGLPWAVAMHRLRTSRHLTNVTMHIQHRFHYTAWAAAKDVDTDGVNSAWPVFKPRSIPPVFTLPIDLHDSIDFEDVVPIQRDPLSDLFHSPPHTRRLWRELDELGRWWEEACRELPGMDWNEHSLADIIPAIGQHIENLDTRFPQSKPSIMTLLKEIIFVRTNKDLTPEERHLRAIDLANSIDRFVLIEISKTLHLLTRLRDRIGRDLSWLVLYRAHGAANDQLSAGSGSSTDADVGISSSPDSSTSSSSSGSSDSSSSGAQEKPMKRVHKRLNLHT